MIYNVGAVIGWTQDAIAFYREHPISIGQPIRPEEVIGAWLRECGQIKQDALEQLAACQKEVERMTVSRQQEVQFRQELATLVGEKHPDPQRILRAVKKLIEVQAMQAGGKRCPSHRDN